MDSYRDLDPEADCLSKKVVFIDNTLNYVIFQNVGRLSGVYIRWTGSPAVITPNLLAFTDI